MDHTSVEVWKPIAGFPHSEVSNHGRVRSLFRGGCKLRCLITHANGYLTLTLQRKSFRRRYRVHVLVATAFLGPKPKRMDVNHKDGVKTNNCVENLEYMTHSENCKHGFTLGLSFTPFREFQGVKHPMAILNNDSVRAIRKKYRDGTPRRTLAKQYGISYYTVWDITTGRSWTHIAD
jgi:hypothetical protein